MNSLHRRVAATLCALVCGASLAVGCARLLGIEDLPDECQVDDDCRAGAPVCGDDRVCRACEANRECADQNSEAPICSAGGQCVAGCTASAQCSEAAPYCNTGTGACEACQAPRDDRLCSARDPGKPLCGPGGACVACLDASQCTDATAPVCGDDNACRGCQEHDECASTVCDRDTGACVAESAVSYVAAGGTGDCSRAAPCGTIAAAVELVRADNQARYVVRLDDGTYTEQVALGDITVSIIGDGATIQLDGTTPNAPVVNVTASADITLEGLTIRGANGDTNADGIRCDGGGSSSVEVLQSVITANGDLGIDVVQCNLTVARSAITSNVGGGIQVNTGAFDITNSYVLENGDVRNAFVAGVHIRNGTTFSPQRFAFNTVANNEGGAGAETGGVFCDISLTSSAFATSNIITAGFGGQPAVAGDCEWVYSSIEGKDGIAGTIAADPTNIDANCMLTDRPDDLPAIAAASACAGAGQDDTGITVDYDGAPRPATAPDIGADEL